MAPHIDPIVRVLGTYGVYDENILDEMKHAPQLINSPVFAEQRPQVLAFDKQLCQLIGA